MDLCNQRAPRAPSHPDALRFASSASACWLSGYAGARRVTAALADLGPPLRARAKRSFSAWAARVHVDTFDHKPGWRGATARPSRACGRREAAASPFKFTPSGRTGLMISELFPELARRNKLCLLGGMHQCPAAARRRHLGSFQPCVPRGFLVAYGLGTENDNLPDFVTINPPTGGGGQGYGSAFLHGLPGLRIDARSGGTSAPRRRRWRTSRTRADPQARASSSTWSRSSTASTTARRRARTRSRRSSSPDPPSACVGAAGPARPVEGEPEDPRHVRHRAEETDRFSRQYPVARHRRVGGALHRDRRRRQDHHRNLRRGRHPELPRHRPPIAALLQDLAQRRMLDGTLIILRRRVRPPMPRARTAATTTTAASPRGWPAAA